MCRCEGAAGPALLLSWWVSGPVPPPCLALSTPKNLCALPLRLQGLGSPEQGGPAVRGNGWAARKRFQGFMHAEVGSTGRNVLFLFSSCSFLLAFPPLPLETVTLLLGPGVLSVQRGVCFLSESFPDSSAVKPEIISHKRQHSGVYLYFKESSAACFFFFCMCVLEDGRGCFSIQ